MRVDVTASNPEAGQEGTLKAEIDRLKSDLIRAENKIAELEASADTDPLLGILNRRGFERELARSLAFMERYGTGATLIYIDLDGFKAVNDRHGHAAGDLLLKAVAATLTAHVRASDVVARLGGDEFAVLMWHVDETRALAKAMELERSSSMRKRRLATERFRSAPAPGSPRSNRIPMSPRRSTPLTAPCTRARRNGARRARQ